LGKKAWAISASKIKLVRSGFNDTDKTWTFSVECSEPELKDNFVVAIPYRSTDELRTKYLALDAAWQAGAIEARITTALSKNKTGVWEGRIISISIVNVSAKDEVVASKNGYSLIYTPSKPYSTPGRVVLMNPPIIGAVSIGATTIDMTGLRKEKIIIPEVPSLEEVEITWRTTIEGVALDISPQTLSLKPDELLLVVAPTGTLEIEGLPDGSSLHIGNGAGSAIELGPEDRDGVKFALLPGSYSIGISGTVTFDTVVSIKSGTITTLPGYREAVISQMNAQYEKSKRQIASIKPKKLSSVITAGTGLAGLILSGISYSQGAIAMSEYEVALTSDELRAARASAEKWSTIFIVSASAGGLSAAASAILWPWKSNMATLEADMRRAEEALRAFQK